MIRRRVIVRCAIERVESDVQTVLHSLSFASYYDCAYLSSSSSTLTLTLPSPLHTYASTDRAPSDLVRLHRRGARYAAQTRKHTHRKVNASFDLGSFILSWLDCKILNLHVHVKQHQPQAR